MRHGLLLCLALAGAACAAPVPQSPEPPVLPVASPRPPAPLLLVHRQALARIEADLRALGGVQPHGAVGRLLGAAGVHAFGAPMDNEEGAIFGQSFELTVGVVVKPARLAVDDETPRAFDIAPAAMVPLEGSRGHGKGLVVFAGFGIAAPDAGWDDYAGADLKGRVVLALDGGPQLPAGDPRAAALSARAARRDKMRAARDHGAEGLVLIAAGDELEAPTDPAGLGLAGLLVKRSAAKPLLARAGLDDRRLRASTKPGRPRPIGTMDVRLRAITAPRKVSATNVVGIVRANRYSSRRDEHVVVAVRSGGVDPQAREDPSDAAILVEAARRVVETNIEPRRNIVFADFGADDLDAAGVRRWLADPFDRGTVKIDAVIEIGPAGRGPRATLVSAGEGWEKAARSAAADLAFDLGFTGGARPPFDGAGFPVAFLRRPESRDPDGEPSEIARQSTFVARLALALSDRCGAIGDTDVPCPRLLPAGRPAGKHAPWPVEMGPPTWRWEKSE
jgi:hypothetical protein